MAATRIETKPSATSGGSAEVGALHEEGLDMAVTIRFLDWEGFEAIAAVKGDRRRPRLLYEEGSLTLVSPSYLHEHAVDRIDILIKAVCSELAIPCTPAGATLFRRADLDRGIEGDRTYYLAHEAAIRGKSALDLAVDPPPDLAVEVEVHHPATEAVETWRRLGTPEVWVYRPGPGTLAILRPDDEGRYVDSSRSHWFPRLTVAEILGWVESPADEPESFWERRLRAWVRDELAGRLGAAED